MIVNIVMALFFGWLVLLTFVVFQTKKHYMKLSSRTGARSIDAVLDALLRESEDTHMTKERVEKKITELQLAAHRTYRKIGLVPFYAFGKTDGEKSFVIALLNDLNTGLLVNFVYIPDGIRVYAKRVKDGKGINYELTQEEIEAIRKAE